MTEHDTRRAVAQVLRGLRRQPRCAVTRALLLEWHRRALLLQCFRRADRKGCWS